MSGKSLSTFIALILTAVACGGPAASSSPSLVTPTQAPTQAHTLAPTNSPTAVPTPAVTQAPTGTPTQAPTATPTEAPPTSPPPPTGNATGVDGGANHTCAVLSDGSIACWGSNSFGQLGDGDESFDGQSSRTPVGVLNITNAMSVTAGGTQTCALLTGATVMCWGGNTYGKLGDGTETDSYVPTAASITNVSAVSAGDRHTCALINDGSVMCWGHNGYLQLGIRPDAGPNSRSTTPVTVTGVSNATAITTGARHTCALINDGSVMCWGWNDSGQLGDGTRDAGDGRYDPEPVTGVSNAVAIAAGAEHTCALLGDGSVVCWGDNRFGELGDGTGGSFDSPIQTTPVAVTGISDATAIAAGDYHTCALLSSGSVACWGSDGAGQLGDGSDNYVENSSKPIAVTGLAGVTAITAGGHHTCALLTSGGVMCWGSNERYQLGNDSSSDSNKPVAVVGL